MQVGKASVERVHLDDEVGQQWQVGERLDRDFVAVIGQHAHARQLLTAVDA